MALHDVESSKYVKLKKAFVVENGKYVKLKKGFVVENSKYVKIWSCGELKYYGQISSGHSAYDLAGTSNGTYALFAGGQTSPSGSTGAVTAFNTSLTMSTPTKELNSGTVELASSSVGGYALFAGGHYVGSDYSVYHLSVYAYDSSLTLTIKQLTNNSAQLAGTTVGSYALFAGGMGYEQTGPDDYENVLRSNVDSFNSSLTKGTATALSVARRSLSGAHVGNYALFAGGTTSTYAYNDQYLSTVVDTYNTSLTKGTATALSVAKCPDSASVGNYALFWCNNSNINVYNASLTRSLITPKNTIGMMATATLGNYAIFNNSGGASEVYDDSLTCSVFESTGTRFYSAGASIGNYAIFTGGKSSSGSSYPWSASANIFQLDD